MFRFGLLGLLVRQAGDVFSLRADYEALFDNMWPVTKEQIAEALAGLEQEGFVAHEGLPVTALPERPIYEPTAAGRRTLARWLQAAPDDDLPIEDELALKLALNRVLEAGHGLSLVWEERQACKDRLERLYTLRDISTLELPATLLLENAIMAQEARMRWLGFCEERLVEEP